MKSLNKSLWILLLLLPLCVQGQVVDGGNGHAIIMDGEGYVYTVGRNNFGQLGIGGKENSHLPVQVPGLPRCSAISRGYDHSLAVDREGHVWSWGRNNYGQLGGSLPIDVDTPKKLFGLEDIVAIEGGHWHTVALKKNGTVMAWGHNFYGELGNNSREHSEYPVGVKFQSKDHLKDITQIASVGYHTLALDSFGDVYAWGSNISGQLGHFENKRQAYPTKVAGLSNIQSVAVGWHHSMALDKEGRVFVWGSRPENKKHPENGPGEYEEITQLKSLPPVKKIACGSWHSMAVDIEGKVWAWGRNEVGMLGTGDDLDSSEPVLVDGLKNITAVGGGCFQSMSVDVKGKIWTSGKNTAGQLGQEDMALSLNPIEMKLPKPIEGLTLEQFMAYKEKEKKPKNESKEKTRNNPILIWVLGASIFINIVLLFRRRKNSN